MPSGFGRSGHCRETQVDARYFQPLLRVGCADGVYVFCCDDRGWSILRDDVVVARGAGDGASVDKGIEAFIEVTSIATHPANRHRTSGVPPRDA